MDNKPLALLTGIASVLGTRVKHLMTPEQVEYKEQALRDFAKYGNRRRRGGSTRKRGNPYVHNKPGSKLIKKFYGAEAREKYNASHS